MVKRRQRYLMTWVTCFWIYGGTAWHIQRAGCLCKHWCLAFAMYLRCLGGVESKTSKALFGTVSSEAKNISSPLLLSTSIYLTQHIYRFTLSSRKHN